MNDPNLSRNRRGESRYYFDSGARIAWRRDGYRTRRRRGWLNEKSHSGMSFFVESDRRPALGDDIEVSRPSGPDTTLYHVVRIMPLDGNISLVGCRSDTAVDVSAPDDPRCELRTGLTETTNTAA